MTQFEEACIYTVNTIKQFFYVKDLRGENACVVLVVEDNPDLMIAADYIHRAGILKEDYGRIFFTGEGIIREAKTEEIGDCFLRMRDAGGNAFDFTPASVPFAVAAS